METGVVGAEQTTFSVEYIQNNMDVLKRIIDPDFGLGAELISRRLLTLSELESVEKKDSFEDRNIHLLELMSKKSNDHRLLFLECLKQTSQSHVFNYIRGISYECSVDLPLDEPRTRLLIDNFNFIVTELECGKLITAMYDDECKPISLRHIESIEATPTNSKKNELLLKILFRRSIAHFNAFVRCLNEIDQTHIAQCFKGDGAMIKVVAQNFTQNSEIVERIKYLLRSASSDELREVEELVELIKQGVNLIDVQHGSVRLYFWCLNESSVLVLKEWVETGRLQTVIEKMFALVSSKRSPAPVRLSYDREQFDRALRLFDERNKVKDDDCGDDWPLEEFELIKLRFYRMFLLTYGKGDVGRILRRVHHISRVWLYLESKRSLHLDTDENSLDILSRSSIRSFKSFIKALRAGAKLIADVLESSGVVVTVNMHITHSKINFLEYGHDLRNYILQIHSSTRTPDDLAEFVENGIELLDMNVEKDVLFFWCKDGKSFDKFTEFVGNSFIQNSLAKFLTHVMVLTEKFSVELTLTEDEKQRCVRFLSAITVNINSTELVATQHIAKEESTKHFAILLLPPEIPAEVLEVVLLNTVMSKYMMLEKLQQQSPAQSAYDILVTLMSVSGVWWETLKRKWNMMQLRRFFKRSLDAYRLSLKHVHDVIRCTCDRIVILRDKLFVIEHAVFSVYEAFHPFGQFKSIILDNFRYRDFFNITQNLIITVCKNNNCIFVGLYSSYSNPNPFIRRLEISEEVEVTKDEPIYLPHMDSNDESRSVVSLSMRSARLLIAIKNKLLLCDVDGNLTKEVQLPEQIATRSAVESRRGTYIACYTTDILKNRQMVGEFNDRGEVVGVFVGELGYPQHQLNLGHILLGAGESVIVSEPHANRILVLDSQLKLIRVETFAINPRRMCFDEETGLLFVSTRGNTKRMIACSMPHDNYDYNMIEVYSVIRKNVSSRRPTPAPGTRHVFDGCLFRSAITN